MCNLFSVTIAGTLVVLMPALRTGSINSRGNETKDINFFGCVQTFYWQCAFVEVRNTNPSALPPAASTPLQIESLPNELFQCKKLRTLNLGNNCLQSLPSRFGELTALTQLELRGNRLECLPVELGECRQLKRTGLVVEEDLFNTLPTEVKEQFWKVDKEPA